MAGDWIPWVKGLTKKLEVLTIAERTNKTPHEVAAILMEFWEWADAETEDGLLRGISVRSLSASHADIDGTFVRAMSEVGWLFVRDNNVIEVPNFERWMGRSAKRRLKETERRRNNRHKAPEVAPNDGAAAKVSASDADKTRPNSGTTEQNRTEQELNTPPIPPKGGGAVTAPTATTTAAPAPDTIATKPVKKTAEPLSREQQDRFSRWWARYPKKVDKVAAVRAWGKILPDEELLARMLAAVTAQLKTDQWERGIIPHPATWLNGRRWEDDPAALDLQRGKTGGSYGAGQNAGGSVGRADRVSIAAGKYDIAPTLCATNTPEQTDQPLLSFGAAQPQPDQSNAAEGSA